METKNLKNLEWRYDDANETALLRITTRKINRPRIFKIYKITVLDGYNYGMDVYDDWAMNESSGCYRSLICVFKAIADTLYFDLAELCNIMVEIDKILA